MPPPALLRTLRSLVVHPQVRWFTLFLLFAAPPALAQQADTSRIATSPDTMQVAPDTLAVPTPPAQPLPPSRSREDAGLDQPVEFGAQDSLVIHFGDAGNDTASLYGAARVTYGETTLEAYRMDVLFDRDELRARGLATDTGYVGLPQFSDGEEPFSGLELAYNLRTERGRVMQGRTSLDDGFIAADVAKVTEDSTLYIQDGSYTTCDCPPGETPSYSLRSQKMKVVNQERIYTGPIQLYIFNIPTPLWLPFGFLPAKEGRRSGPLPPQYGEDQRGFYLRGWGWYQAINEYTDLQLRAGIWSKGSWQFNPTFRYNRRYRYNGRLSIDYLRELSGERDDPDVIIQRRASLRWNHNQTLSPSANLRANIDLTSSGYLRTVSEQYSDNVRQQVTSSINYSKQWQQAGRSLSLSARQTQTLSTGVADLTLPSLDLRQSSRTPFKRDRRAPGQDERWFEKLTVSYSGSVDNRYRFEPLDDDTLAARGDTAAADISWYEALIAPSKYRRATGDATPFDFQASHRVPLSMPFILNRVPLTNRTLQFNVTPNATYTEDWFLRTERRQVDSTGTLIRDETTGFFALRQFSTGVSTNTTFYGIFPVGVGPYQGVRHTVRPTLSFTYTPDFRSDTWGYTRTYVDAQGNERRYPIVSGVSREQRALNMRLSNVFETRRVPTDSTQQRRTLKLFNVDASTSYNFAADSLKLSDIRLSGRTRVLDRLGLNVSASYSPYAADSTGRPIDDYVFSLRDVRLARLTSLRVTGDFSVRGGQGAGMGQRLTTSPGGPLPGSRGFAEAGGTFGERDPFSPTDYDTETQPTNFAIPWSLNLSFTYALNRFGTSSNRTLTLNSSFDFSLTPRWRVRGNTGYDFEQKELVTTRLFIARDFECWEMSFSWVPFGDFQQYGFDLHVKSGKLRDLLRIRQPRAEIGNRFGDAL